MKTIYIWLLALICSLLLFSCYKDEGNYDYKEINEIRIGKLENKSQYTNIDRLEVTPDVQYTRPNGKYGYTWVARSLSERTEDMEPVDYLLGTDKNLDYFVDLNIGDYIVTFTVTDSVASLKWSSSFNLTVASATYTGWMVLCDENGYARLDMVEESGDTPLYSRNILSNTPLAPKKDPRKMVAFTLDWMDSFEIFMLTGEGCSKLVASDLSWEESNDFRYTLANPSQGDMKVQNMCPSSIRGTLMIGDHNAYWRQQQGGSLFGLPVSRVDGQQVRVSPYIGVQMSSSTLFGANNFILFDEENDRFLRFASGSNSCSVLSDFPQGYQLKYMQNTVYSQGISYAILYKEDTREYKLLSFYAENLQVAKFIPLEIPNMDDISLFAFDPVFPYLFYAEGGQLYLYDWTAGKPEKRIIPMQNFKDERITMLKYNVGFYAHYQGTAVGTPDQYLLVGTATKDNKGSLHLLEPQATITKPVEHDTHTGFAVIVDATYRER